MYQSYVKTQSLIQNFEQGKVNLDHENGEAGHSEKIESYPGVTKKMVQTYESMNQGRTASNFRVTRKPQSTPSNKTKLHVLIVHAHEEPDSLNSSITNVTKETLEAQGHTVTLSDLYAQKFNPVLGRADIKGDKPSGRFFYSAAVKDAYMQGRLADDIIAEHNKLRRADLVIFQFPMHWGGMPAILQGWMDRVFTPGFAFLVERGQVFDNGCMKGKKALLSATLGGAHTAFTNRGLMGDVNAFLWQIQNMALRFCGFDILAPHLVYGTLFGLTDQQGDDILAAWRQRLTQIHMERTVSFVPMYHFEPRSMLMKDEVLKKLSQGSSNGPMKGLTLGQNLGNAFPPDSMYTAGLQFPLEEPQYQH